MKKIAILSLGLLALMVVSKSCKNDAKEVAACKTCEIAPSSKITMEVFDHVLELNKYSGERNFYVFPGENGAQLNTLLKGLVENENELAAFALFASNENDEAVLQVNEVRGCALYERVESGYNVRIFEMKNNKFEEIEKSNLKSNFLASNDLVELSKIVNAGGNTDIIAFIDFKNLYTKNAESELQFFIENESKLASNKTEGQNGGEKDCQPPCTFATNARCTAQESQSGLERWFCLGRCTQSEAQAKMVENGHGSLYDYAELESIMYTFRDEYLSNQLNGDFYISLYYDLSSRFNYSNLTISYCLDLFDVLDNIDSKLISLATNPNSTSIVLIDQSTGSLLIAFLNESKQFFDNQTDIDEIDNLIDKVSLFVGKNNNFISSNL